MNVFKDGVLAVVGAAGGGLAYLFGGWDSSMITLVIFMGVDYVTGLAVAGIFKRSGKTESGALNSAVGLTGLLKKGMGLAIVLVAARLDLVIGTDIVRDGVVIAFIANETISIIENAGLMGVPIPAVITRAIEVLQNKGK
jgi:toxin secretion/phage lysis holin